MHNTLGAFAAVALATMLAQGRADAHDHWANGAAVPAWVKAQCCGTQDVHHLDPSQVHVTPSGYRVDGYRATIPEERLQPSPDGEWWVFYRDAPAGSEQGPVLCFFGPTRGS